LDDWLEAIDGAGEDFLSGGGVGGAEGGEGFFEEVGVGRAIVHLAPEGVG
jgi:hypothetical protein